MYLVEQHIIKINHPFYKECDELCFKSKNLYNSGLYAVRKHFFEEKKFKTGFTLINEFVKGDQFDYRQLVSYTSQQTLLLVEQNFKSFFGSLKSKRNGTNDRKVNIPNYLDKVKGRQVTTFINRGLSKKEFKKTGRLKLSMTNIFVRTQIKDFSSIKLVSIVPKNCHYVIEVCYTKVEKELKQNNGRYASIDLGLNNLATVSSNVVKPIIINGKPLKSVNQYYNKKLAKLKSNSKNKTTKRITRLHNKRNNKVKDYLHKSSRYIVNHLVSNSINTLVIGHNKEWKQEINIGKVNNQNFANIPHSTFIHMLKYKCFLEGIDVIETEESYTSKCSFLDNESVEKHDVYKGTRIKRGLFKSKKHGIINADVNGSLNILRKAVGKFKYNPIEVRSSPLVHTIKFN